MGVVYLLSKAKRYTKRGQQKKMAEFSGIKSRVRLQFMSNKPLFIIYGILVVMVIAGLLVFPVFRSRTNISFLMNQAVILGIVSLGQTLPILLSGLDMSVGSVMSLSTTLAVVLLRGPVWTYPLAFIAIMAAGSAVGYINGLGVAKLNMVPIIVTLSTMIVISGVALFVLPQPGGFLPEKVLNFFLFEIGVFQGPVFYYVAIIIIMYYYLHHTVSGRHIYATGGDKERASLTGVQVDRSIITGYILSGFLASVAGIFLTLRINSGAPRVGEPFLLDCITAVLLGGTTFVGGRGGIIGTVGGTLVMTVLANILVIAEVHTYYQYIARAVVLFVAVVAYTMKRRHI
jgi:ribose/xylose/arabinose/galactoside ABC-type transport system permease subunit